MGVVFHTSPIAIDILFQVNFSLGDLIILACFVALPACSVTWLTMRCRRPIIACMKCLAILSPIWNNFQPRQHLEVELTHLENIKPLSRPQKVAIVRNFLGDLSSPGT